MPSFDKSPRKKKTKRKTKAMATMMTMMTMMTIKLMMATRSDVCSNLSCQDLFGGDRFGRSSIARGGVVGERPASGQAQGSGGRHNQGSEASLLLSDAG